MTTKCIADIKDHEKFIANNHLYQKIVMVNIADGTEHDLFLDYGEVNNDDNERDS